jgi:hypothetical protein
LAHVWDGPGAADHIDTVYFEDEDDEPLYGWDDVTVLPGQTVIYVHFPIQSFTPESATEQADSMLDQTATPYLFTGMSVDEVNAIQNWVVAEITDTYNPGQEDSDNDGIGNICDAGEDTDDDGVPDEEDLVNGEPAGYDVTQVGHSVTVTSQGNPNDVIFTSTLTTRVSNLQITRTAGSLLKIEGMPANSNKTVYFPNSPAIICVQDTPTLTLTAGDRCAGDNKFVLACPGQTHDPTDGDLVTCNMNGTTAVVSPLDHSGIASYSPGGGGGGGGYRSTLTAPVSEVVPGTEIATEKEEKMGEEAVTAEELKNPFTDIIGHFAEPYVKTLYQKGVVKGKTATTFAPNDKVTRAELIKMIVEAFDIPLEYAGSTVFADVDSNAWYASYVEAAYKAGVTEGYFVQEKGVYKRIFKPDQPVNRAEALKMILVAAGAQFSETATVKFPDTTLDAWYAKYLSFAKLNGIVSGYADGKFRPANNVTRGEAAKMIVNMMEM